MRGRFHAASCTRPLIAFYSIAAQHDNLGDVVIRRRMLEWLDGAGVAVYVYAGSMPASYVAAFDFTDRITVVRTRSKLLRDAVHLLRHGRILLVFPPGPGAFGGPKRNLRLAGRLLAVSALSACGGGGLLIGGSVRQQGCAGSRLYAGFLSALRLSVMRDVRSLELSSGRARLAPDLAFGSWHPQEGRNRFRLSVSLRSDQPVDRATLRYLNELAAAEGWRLTFVTQVKRDDPGHHRLAKEMGADVVAWQGSHSEQLVRVQDAYAESLAVVSDRLHALIFAANSGSLPVALVHTGVDKLTSSFSHVCSLPRIDVGRPAFDNLSIAIHDYMRNPESLERELATADEILMNVREEAVQLIDALGGEGATQGANVATNTRAEEKWPTEHEDGS